MTSRVVQEHADFNKKPFIEKVCKMQQERHTLSGGRCVLWTVQRCLMNIPRLIALYCVRQVSTLLGSCCLCLLWIITMKWSVFLAWNVLNSITYSDMLCVYISIIYDLGTPLLVIVEYLWCTRCIFMSSWLVCNQGFIKQYIMACTVFEPCSMIQVLCFIQICCS